MVISAVMVFPLTPINGVLAQPCEHHTEHTADCGYVEAVEGQECSHEHTEECYLTETKCVHEHSPECYPAERGPEGTDALAEGDGNTESQPERTDTPAEGDGNTESGAERTDASAEGSKNTENGLERTEVSAEGSENTESQPTACPHVCSEESGCVVRTLNCTHEHDAKCGYVAGVEGSPCAFVCTECGNGIAQSENSPDEGMTKGNPLDEKTAEEAQNAQALIDGLPSGEEAGNMSDDNQQNAYTQTREANDAYEALSAEEQEQVNAAKLEALFSDFNSLTMAVSTTSTVQTSDSVAEVGGVYYTDFLEALEATYDTGSGMEDQGAKYCKLLKDVTVNGDVGTYYSKRHYIDLNGKTLTCGTLHLWGPKGSWLKGSGTVNGNIEIVGGGSFRVSGGIIVNGNISQPGATSLRVRGSGIFRVNGDIGDFSLSSEVDPGVTIVCTGTCSETDIQNKVITDPCKVDITWGSMEFTYKEAQTWNPETVSYDENSRWEPAAADGNKIQVTNKGYDPVNVTYEYTQTDTAVAGAFYKDASGTTPVTAPVTVWEIGGTDTAYLHLSGSPTDKSGGKAALGNVQVTINGTSGGN